MTRTQRFFLFAAAILIPLAPPVVSALGVDDGPTTPARADAPPAAALDLAGRELPSFRDAVRAISPSVVNISTSRDVVTGSPGAPFGGHLQPFGGDLFAPFFRAPVPRRHLQQRALGSGVIVTADGHLLTNNHVVQGADQITVTLADGRTFEAEVVGTDAPTDLAVLSIDADGLLPARLADSDDVEVGDWVLAVGNPFGLGHTVTSGIVGAKQRSGVGITEYEDFLQTDAAINPGNSGGPLVDLRGRIVGINTAIATRTGGYQGIGFAIPGEMVRRVMGDLIDHGHVERGQLGVYIQDLTPELARSFEHEGQGVLVSQVMEGSAAAEAGVRAGDIVTHIDGRAMTSANALATMVATLSQGARVELRLVRDGEPLSLTATIRPAAAPRERPADGGQLERLGLDVQSVTSALARQHDLAVAAGVMVSGVEPGGLAQLAGLRPGDVILSVDGAEVADVEAFRAALAESDLGEGLRLLVDSAGRRRYVLLRFGP